MTEHYKISKITHYNELPSRKERIYFSPNNNGELKVSGDQRCSNSKLEQEDLEEIHRALKKIFKSKERTQRD